MTRAAVPGATPRRARHDTFGRTHLTRGDRSDIRLLSSTRALDDVYVPLREREGIVRR
ncbi:hypothetical protein ACLQ3C_03265 [Gordonia sp. DT30]|uniref:hypothetical protein n=1 Tax=unclassified Gordonia (in: high G+C Gram-positive bacteria) TaxID=2657482 RepID=UPI003CECEB55